MGVSPPIPSLVSDQTFSADAGGIQKMLLQTAPAGGPPAQATLSPTAGGDLRVLRINVVNTTGAAVVYKIYHDDSGTAATATEMILTASVAANSHTVLDVDIPLQSVAPVATLTLESATASALTFTLYGR